MAKFEYPSLQPQLSNFSRKLDAQSTSQQCWCALQILFADTVGCALFTVMTVDMKNQLARRAG